MAHTILETLGCPRSLLGTSPTLHLVHRVSEKSQLIRQVHVGLSTTYLHPIARVHTLQSDSSRCVLFSCPTLTVQPHPRPVSYGGLGHLSAILLSLLPGLVPADSGT